MSLLYDAGVPAKLLTKEAIAAFEKEEPEVQVLILKKIDESYGKRHAAFIKAFLTGRAS